MRPTVNSEQAGGLISTVVNGSYIVAGVLEGVNTGAGRGTSGYGHSRARAG